MDERFSQGIKTMVDVSNTLGTWSLSIVGGSILAVVSSSFIKPSNKKMRLSYLLFIPGWISLATSIYFGNTIPRTQVTAVLTKDNSGAIDMIMYVNDQLRYQLGFFQAGIAIFTIWLIIFLLWWVFFYVDNKEISAA